MSSAYESRLLFARVLQTTRRGSIYGNRLRGVSGYDQHMQNRARGALATESIYERHAQNRTARQLRMKRKFRSWRVWA